ISRDVRAGVGDGALAHFDIVHEGLPVFDAHVVGEVAPPWGVTALLVHVPRDLDVPPSPTLTSGQALDAARSTPDLIFADVVEEPVLGVFNAGLFLDEPTESHLAWRVALTEGDVFVDAERGEILWADIGDQEALDL